MSTSAKPTPPDSPKRRGVDARPPDRRPHQPLPQTDEERLLLARERAKTYRPAAARDEGTAMAADLTVEPRVDEEEIPQTLDEWQNLVSRRVDDAMRQGMFDNLPGQGKPQPVQNDPFVPEDRRMAYNLMKKNQITPGWIGDRKSILAAIAALRAEIAEIGALYWGKAEQIDTDTRNTQVRREQIIHEWNYFVAEWEERVKILNKQILNLNLSQPYHHLEVYQLRLNEELKRVGVAHTLSV